MANLNIHKFENIDCSDLVISVCLDLISIHIHVRYEGSKIKHIYSGEAIILKKKDGCQLKKIGHTDIIFNVHVLGYICLYMYKICHLYNQAFGQRDCPQSTMMPEPDNNT